MCWDRWGSQDTPEIWGLRKENSYRIVPHNIHIHGFEKITLLKNGRILNLSKLLHYNYFLLQNQIFYFSCVFFLDFSPVWALVFLTFQRIWINFFDICAFMSQSSYEGFRGNSCDHSVNRKAKILKGPTFMAWPVIVSTYPVVISKIATKNMSWAHRHSKFAIINYHKWTIFIYFIFFQFVNMYILRYDRYSMTCFIKMEKSPVCQLFTLWTSRVKL